MHFPWILQSYGFYMDLKSPTDYGLDLDKDSDPFGPSGQVT